MERGARLCSALGLLCALGCPRVALAQATGQLWGDTLTIDWLTTERLTYEVELQPQTQRIVHDGRRRVGEPPR